MRTGQAIQAFVKIKLGKFASEHVEPAWRRGLDAKWVTADAAYTRIAERDADGARKRLT